MYDVNKVREDFPILSRQVHGRQLVYLDNAATTQKPLCVLDAMRSEYLNQNANVHRGVHYLSQQATELHEQARERVRQFLGARSTNEIVFTRGTTEAINLVAQTFCSSQMKAGDEVLVTDMEHHSNIVPWQMQAISQGIVVRHLPISDDGRLRLDLLDDFLTERTRLVSLCHVSNVLGTLNPVAEVVRRAHERGIPVLVDAAQSAPHLAIDVQQLGCDFLAFSGHKMYGPTGIGVLYGREEWLDRLPPYQGGGAGSTPPTTSCRSSSRLARPTTSPPTDWPRPSTTFAALASEMSRPTSSCCTGVASNCSATSPECASSVPVRHGRILLPRFHTVQHGLITT